MLTPILALLCCSVQAASPPGDNRMGDCTPTLVVQGTVSVAFHTIWREEVRRTFTWEQNPEGWKVLLSGIPGVSDYTAAFHADGILGCTTVFEGLVREMTRRGVPVGPNLATAQVRAGIVPLFSTEREIGFLWLTFASGVFLSTNTTAYMIPPYAIGFRDGHARFEDLEEQRYSAELARTSRVPFPTKVTYFYGGTNTASVHPQDGFAYSPDWTNALFGVEQTTNVAATIIPRRASLTVFGVHGGEAPFEIGQYSVEVTNAFLQETAVNLIPILPGTTFVTEGRLADPARRVFFNYWTNRWLTAKEIRALPEYSRALALLGLSERRLTWQGVVLGAACLGILLLPLLAARSRQHNDQRRTKGTTNA